MFCHYFFPKRCSDFYAIFIQIIDETKSHFPVTLPAKLFFSCQTQDHKLEDETIPTYSGLNYYTTIKPRFRLAGCRSFNV